MQIAAIPPTSCQIGSRSDSSSRAHLRQAATTTMPSFQEMRQQDLNIQHVI